MGSDLTAFNLSNSWGVSIHAPAWGATRLRLRLCRDTRGFNSRSRMGSDSFAFCLSRRDWFQFTLPHGERREVPAAVGDRAVVSIHAPAWGATGGRAVVGGDGLVSIHAPAWGATRRPARRGWSCGFQFTLPHGERHGEGRGAGVDIGFNSRSRMGSDCHFAPPFLNRRQFQFTLPHGERPFSPSPSSPLAEFQFTLPHGERLEAQRGADVAGVVSIHAPAWGATHGRPTPGPGFKVSIHAPAWGATLQRPRLGRSLLFQFTLPHGERPPG